MAQNTAVWASPGGGFIWLRYYLSTTAISLEAPTKPINKPFLGEKSALLHTLLHVF